MRLEQTPRPQQGLHVNARLVTSSTILHLSSDEFERAVTQEQMENPSLEVQEQRICLFCGTPLYGVRCPVCGHFAQQYISSFIHDDSGPYSYGSAASVSAACNDHQQVFYDIDNYGFMDADGDDDFDPMARIATDETLAETLLQQLETLITPADAPIAEQLIGNLNERGYLDIDLEEIARPLEVPVERVEYVLHQLQTLEPVGIGARNLRECLLIQLHALSEQETPHPLAAILIDQYLDRLGRNQFQEIAKALKQSESDIRQAYQYIRSRLHPFPAQLYRQNTAQRLGGAATYVRPDVIIRKHENGFEVELIEERRYSFHITSPYTPGTQALSHTQQDDVQKYMRQHNERAQFFVDCIQRRWRTLRRVTEFIVDYQRDFFEKGVRALHPLTRAEVAARLGLDEGTVSRATANKYALLPNGRLIPLADFFDGSLGIKDILRELIQSEHPKHRLSDDELARLLNERGIPMARRTVTKYREEMGIGSSRERG